MDLSITTHFAFELSEPADVLLQFEAAETSGQRILDSNTNLTPGHKTSRVPAQDNLGERLWLHGQGLIEVDYTAKVAVNRPSPNLAGLSAIPLHALPGETAQYLFDSRYCQADQFQSFVNEEFANSSAGARISAITAWIAGNFSYQPGVSDARTDARDSFIERQGICRDYAHVLIALARASGIPARFVAGYAPHVNPPDFHAVAEVFLEDPDNDGVGTWHLIDATGMADASAFARIGVGRDAADVSFLTSFGPCDFLRSSVEVNAWSNE